MSPRLLLYFQGVGPDCPLQCPFVQFLFGNHQDQDKFHGDQSYGGPMSQDKIVTQPWWDIDKASDHDGPHCTNSDLKQTKVYDAWLTTPQQDCFTVKLLLASYKWIDRLSNDSNGCGIAMHRDVLQLAMVAQRSRCGSMSHFYQQTVDPPGQATSPHPRKSGRDKRAIFTNPHSNIKERLFSKNTLYIDNSILFLSFFPFLRCIALCLGSPCPRILLWRHRCTLSRP